MHVNVNYPSIDSITSTLVVAVIQRIFLPHSIKIHRQTNAIQQEERDNVKYQLPSGMIKRFMYVHGNSDSNGDRSKTLRMNRL